MNFVNFYRPSLANFSLWEQGVPGGVFFLHLVHKFFIFDLEHFLELGAIRNYLFYLHTALLSTILTFAAPFKEVL